MKLHRPIVGVIAVVPLASLGAGLAATGFGTSQSDSGGKAPQVTETARIQSEQACCRPIEGTCNELEPIFCLSANGRPQGPETVCTGAIACCLPDGLCVDVDPLCCDDIAGIPSPGGEPACLNDNDEPPNDIDDACEGAVWENWQYPPTLTVRNPLSDLLDGHPLSMLDTAGLERIAARFEVNATNGIEVSVFLGTGTKYDDPSGPPTGPVSVSIEVFEEDLLGVTVAQVDLSIPPDAWNDPYGWYSAVINQGLVGVCWISVGLGSTTPGSAIQVMTEFQDGQEHTLTWDPAARRYEERDGLAWKPGEADPTPNFKDPYIRIRKKNSPPVVVDVSLDPTIPPATVTWFVTDIDGLTTIADYSFKYMYNGGTLVTVAEAPSSILDVAGRRQVAYNLGTLSAGVYRYFFAAQDENATWSESTIDQPFVLNSGSEGCKPLPTPALGPVMDECGTSEGTSDTLCQFLGLGEASEVPVVDPDGNATDIENTYSACFNVPWSAIPAENRVLFRLSDSSQNVLEDVIAVPEDVRKTGNANEERWYATLTGMADLPSATSSSYDLTIMAVACITDECDEVMNLPTTMTDCSNIQLSEGDLPSALGGVTGLTWDTWPCSDATVHVNPPPVWYDKDHVGLEEVTWHEEERVYEFVGQIPWNPDWIYPATFIEQDIELNPYFGTLENEVGARIVVDEHWAATGTALERSAEGGITARLLSFDVYEKPFDITYSEPDGYDVSFTSVDLWDDETTLVDDYSLDERFILMPYGYWVYVEFLLSVDLGIEVWFTLGSTINSLLQLTPIWIEPGVRPYLTFDVCADLYWGVARLGWQMQPAMIYTLPFCYDWSLTEDQFYLDDGTLTMEVLGRVYACAAWVGCVYGGWETLYEQQQDFPPPGAGAGMSPPGMTHGPTYEPYAGMAAATTQHGGIPYAFANPRVASDGTGNAMAVWIHQDDSDSTPDVYYSYFNGASWSGPPAPVRTTDYAESDPTLTFFTNGQALLVVTQNQWTEGEMAGQSADAIMAGQELVYSVYDPPPGSGWSSYVKVKNDDGGTHVADGRAELSPGPRDNPFVVWVRDEDAQSCGGATGDGSTACSTHDDCTGPNELCVPKQLCTGGDNNGQVCDPHADCPGGRCDPGSLFCVVGPNDGATCDPSVDCPSGTCDLSSVCSTFPQVTCNTDIWASRWNGSGWSGEAQIGGGSTQDCCVEPDVAVDSAGNAIAVWIQDDSTAGDRVIKASYYDNALWGTAYTAVDSTSDTCLDLRGLLWPTVGFDAADLPLIVFTARTGPLNTGLMPSGDPFGEGTNDFLFAARRSGGGASDTTKFDRIETVGGPYQHRGRWPRMVVGTPSTGDPIAFVGTRWFKGGGFDGFDGEVGIIKKSLAPMMPCPCRGDLNDNSFLDPDDVTIAEGCAVAGSPCGPCAAADVNCDGVVNTNDSGAVQCLLDCGTPETCCSGAPSVPASEGWPQLFLLTDDEVQDWQVDVDIDFTNPGGTLRVVWVRPSSYDPINNPTLPFTGEFDGIKLEVMDLGLNTGSCCTDYGTSSAVCLDEVDSSSCPGGLFTPGGECTLCNCPTEPIDDGDVCTDDVCNPFTGEISHEPSLPGTPCDDDGDPCTPPGQCDGADPPTCVRVECFVSSPAEPETLDLPSDPISTKIRYVSFKAGDELLSQAVRVTFANLPAPYDTWNGTQLWVQQPQVYCENAGTAQPVAPATECPTAAGGLPQNWFWGAQLGCDPYFTDWTAYEVVHVWDEGIIPRGVYDVQAVDESCSLTAEEDYSAPLTLTQSMWADLVQDCSTTPCKPPDGSTGIVDVTAILDKWKNLPGNVQKARADIEGSPAGDHRLPDQAINITDVTYCLGAFLGDQYPGPGFPPPSPPPVCP